MSCCAKKLSIVIRRASKKRLGRRNFHSLTKTWDTECKDLSFQFFDKWRFSDAVFNSLQRISGKSRDEIVNCCMDHLTYNVGNQEEAEIIGEILNKNHQLEKVENLTFIQDQVHGYLMWIPNKTQYHRKAGVHKPSGGAQGIFVRYMTDAYLKELKISRKEIQGWNLSSFMVNETTSFGKMMNQHRYYMDREKREQLRSNIIANRYLTSYLTNGVCGHFAVDVIALGTNLKNIENDILSHEIDSKQFALFHNWNQKKTVRQLYLYEKQREIRKMDDDSNEEPLEIFFELVERDEVTSISAKKIEKVPQN